MPADKIDLEILRNSIGVRWEIRDWDKLFPWWRPPADVRILFYADSLVHFNGGDFHGLQHVATTLTLRAYPYVKFHVEFAHRDGSDPSATIAGARQLTDLDIMNKYDQVWLFGFGSQPSLTVPEITLMNEFMAGPKFGGILVTGDHARLGFGLSEQIPRVGKMRTPAPVNQAPGWNTTLEEGPDGNSTFDFDEQSDEKPQTIRYKRYPMEAGLALSRRFRPHPLLCGPNGPITVLPDHQHEGEAVAPVPAAGDQEWPTKNGHQEAPEVIGWGRIKDPAATKHGQEIGVISVYNGHNVDVGRIVADSTWHHWFDINLTGRYPGAPYNGFDATTQGQAILKKIEAYFLNCGVWLSPPDKQVVMRNATLWSITWSNQITELSENLPLWRWGEEAIDALGRMASRCTIQEWIFDEPIFKEKIPWWEWRMIVDRFTHVRVPLEQYVIGGIVKKLATEVGPHNPKLSFPQKPLDGPTLSRLVSAGTKDGLSTMTKDLKVEARLLSQWLDGGFPLTGPNS